MKKKLNKGKKVSPKNNSGWKLAENKELGISLHYMEGQKKKQNVFLAKEIERQFKHSNIRRAMKQAHCVEGKDYVVLKKKDHPAFFAQLCNLRLQTSRTPTITILYESGFNLLLLNSKLEIGIKTKHWLARDVMPSLRETGTYTLGQSAEAMDMLETHTHIPEQKLNSQRVNDWNFKHGGKEAAIKYNQDSCFIFTGFYPHELKLRAREKGYKSVVYNSAKNVIRAEMPEVACGMSFTDSMVSAGVKFNQAAALTKKHLLPVFRQMLDWGLTPGELNAAG